MDSAFKTGAYPGYADGSRQYAIRAIGPRGYEEVVP